MLPGEIVHCDITDPVCISADAITRRSSDIREIVDDDLSIMEFTESLQDRGAAR